MAQYYDTSCLQCQHWERVTITGIILAILLPIKICNVHGYGLGTESMCILAETLKSTAVALITELQHHVTTTSDVHLFMLSFILQSFSV